MIFFVNGIQLPVFEISDNPLIDKQSRTGSGGWITPPSSGISDYSAYPAKGSGVYPATPFDQFIRQASNRYEVDETLIRAIIEVESSYRPDVISKSNAVGLMQIKASTAGRDAYRVKGRNGEPSTRELLDPQTNIDIGTISGLDVQGICNIKQTFQGKGCFDPGSLDITDMGPAQAYGIC